MVTNRQRREAERQERLRQEASARKRRLSALAGAILTLAVIVVVVVVVLVNRSGSGDSPASSPSGGSSTTSSGSSGSSASPSASASQAVACGQEQFPTETVRAAKGATVSFKGVKVVGAADLDGKPGTTSSAAASPSKLLYKDLVVGKGQAAGPTSCVTVQYDGVLYKSGKAFDSSWSRGQLAQFPLTGVVPGFTQGIGGTTGVPPMKVGGRRVIIVPPALGYGAQGSPPVIPGNAPLVFVIDLTKVSSAS